MTGLTTRGLRNVFRAVDRLLGRFLRIRTEITWFRWRAQSSGTLRVRRAASTVSEKTLEILDRRVGFASEVVRGVRRLNEVSKSSSESCEGNESGRCHAVVGQS